MFEIRFVMIVVDSTLLKHLVFPVNYAKNLFNSINRFYT